MASADPSFCHVCAVLAESPVPPHQNVCKLAFHKWISQPTAMCTPTSLNAIHAVGIVWGVDARCAHALHIPCSACVHAVVQLHAMAELHNDWQHHPTLLSCVCADLSDSTTTRHSDMCNSAHHMWVSQLPAGCTPVLLMRYMH